MPDFRDVNPRELRLPSSRRSGADSAKLQRQISLFGSSLDGMPTIWVREGSDGFLLILDGVTRATRSARLQPGCLLRGSCFKVAASLRTASEGWRSVAMNASRRNLLNQLSRLSELAPDMRLGQLIANLASMADGPWDETLWNLDDDKLLAAANQFTAELERRNVPVA